MECEELKGKLKYISFKVNGCTKEGRYECQDYSFLGYLREDVEKVIKSLKEKNDSLLKRLKNFDEYLERTTEGHWGVQTSSYLRCNFPELYPHIKEEDDE